MYGTVKLVAFVPGQAVQRQVSRALLFKVRTLERLLNVCVFSVVISKETKRVMTCSNNKSTRSRRTPYMRLEKLESQCVRVSPGGTYAAI